MPDQESNVSRWFNPLTIAIYVAALTIVGNVVTNILSNRAATETERLRSQSNLVLEIIKTNGNADTACKNLNFVVRVGLLDDRAGTINNVCGEKTGVPTLPSSGTTQPYNNPFSPYLSGVLSIRVVDDNSHAPIEHAKVEVKPSPLNNIVGIEPSTSVLMTDSTGLTSVAMISALDNVTVSKEGYEPLTESGGQVLSSLPSSSGQLFGSLNLITIELHQLSKSHGKNRH